VLVGEKGNLHYLLILALQNTVFENFDFGRLISEDGDDHHRIPFSSDVVGRDITDAGAIEDFMRIVVASVDPSVPANDLHDAARLDHLFELVRKKMRSDAQYDDPFFMTYRGWNDEAAFLRRLDDLGLRRREHGFLLRETPGLHEIVPDLIHVMGGIHRICPYIKT